MRKDNSDRRQVGEGLPDEAAPRDHLPPGSEPRIDDVVPDEPPRGERSDSAELTGEPPAQRTPGEAGDAVRPHNEGQARQGPR